jgi:glycosyltransferase involved in cell wall biosynthesis
MKIAIVSPYALPEKGAASMRVDSFAKYFISKKNETVIFTSFKKKNRGYLDYIYHYKSFLDLIKKIKKFDIVILTSPSIKIVFALSFVLSTLKIPFIVDIRDLAKNSKFSKIKSLMEKISLRLSSGISVVTKYVKKFLEKDYKIPPNKIIIVPNGVDKKIFYPEYDSKIRGALNIGKKSKIVFYEGIIGDHDLNLFLEKIDKKLIKELDIYFVFALIVGDVETKSIFELEKFQNKIKDSGLTDRIRILRNIEPNELRKYISSSDMGLAIIPQDENNLYRIPIKAYEYMACGIPVLAIGPKNGELNKLILENKSGIFIQDFKKINEKIEFMIKNKTKIEKNISDKFDREKSAEKLFEMIKRNIRNFINKEDY